ncbi:phosphoserine phosphatase SerB [Proteobacteria bacterium 005FR1]|nr:phosphoserine phosphatase SerB [Proteobacteria bacterium 005FR1]
MTTTHELLLITLSGEDRPGVTSTITAVLANYGAAILDIGQAVIHDTLTLGILVEIPSEYESSPVLKDLLFCAHKLDMQVRFQPITEDSYQEWVSHQGKARHIVTLLARKITSRQIAEVTAVAARHRLNIDNISRLSGRIPLDTLEKQNKACVEFSVRGDSADLAKLRAEFMELATGLDIDIAIQEDNVYRRNRRLVCFDMDSTLVEAEVIDELAKAAGVGDQVAAITEQAMAGELDFNQSFSRRMALLKGLDAKVLESIAAQLPITEGAERLISTLRKLGYKTAILSGGFTYFAKHLQQKLGIDYVYANELEVVDGKVTGKVVGEVVNGQKKAELLKQLARQENILLEQVIAVGDGANDLPMLSIAGLGIAYRAKPLVKASAEHSISNLGLDAILYLLGFRDRDN